MVDMNYFYLAKYQIKKRNLAKANHYINKLHDPSNQLKLQLKLKLLLRDFTVNQSESIIYYYRTHQYDKVLNESKDQYKFKYKLIEIKSLLKLMNYD